MSETITAEETATALEQSIVKWEARAVIPDGGKMTEAGAEACPLCNLFFDADCVGCPVAIQAKTDICQATPYQDWYYEWNKSKEKMTPKLRELTIAEVNFLKGLRS